MRPRESAGGPSQRGSWLLTPAGIVDAAARFGRRLLAGVDRLGRPATRRRLGLAGRVPVLVAGVLAAVLAGLVVPVVIVALIAGGVTASAAPARSTQPPPGRVVTESMVIQTGTMDGRPGWPRFTHPFWTVRAGDTVVLRITSYDDGTAPLTGSQASLGKVSGTVGGTELVNGKPIRSISAVNVAHTFTVVGLGLNVPIPAAPNGGSVTVVARFVAAAAGSYVWQCYAPCGSGPNSMGGAMSAMGWMSGRVRVAS